MTVQDYEVYLVCEVHLPACLEDKHISQQPLSTPIFNGTHVSSFLLPIRSPEGIWGVCVSFGSHLTISLGGRCPPGTCRCSVAHGARVGSPMEGPGCSHLGALNLALALLS